MFEELYEDIPDLDLYLKRIGIKKPTVLNKETLDEIIFAHQCSIPFENLDSGKYKNPVNLSIQDLFNKVIINKRGGYCFELNGLFWSFLKTLGYDVYCCAARVREVEGYQKSISHRGVIVKFDDGLYFGDVGFGGPMPAGLVKIEEGLKQDVRGEEFGFERIDENWWRLFRTNEAGEREVVLWVCTIPFLAVDFKTISYYYSNSPESIFTQKVMVNLRKPNGHYAITDDLFTGKIDGVKLEQKIESEEQFNELLEKYFGIVIK